MQTHMQITLTFILLKHTTAAKRSWWFLKGSWWGEYPIRDQPEKVFGVARIQSAAEFDMLSSQQLYQECMQEKLVSSEI